MAKNVLFLIHGVGVHPDNWSTTEVQNALVREYDRYIPKMTDKSSLDKHLDFVEVNYDNIFDMMLARWEKMAKEFGPSSKNGGATAALEGLLGSAVSGSGQLASNETAKGVGDALLYRGFSLIARLVQLTVAAKIARVVADRRNTDASVEFGVLGHSLGTAVLHDALELLCTNRWDQEKKSTTSINDLKEAFKVAGVQMNASEKATTKTIPTTAALYDFANEGAFGPGNFTFKAIYQVSNTSLKLNRALRSPYESIVRPGVSAESVAGICRQFYNVNHRLDPVSVFGDFQAIRLAGQTEASQSAWDIVVDHVHQANIHALEHYVINPKVHALIFADLVQPFSKEARLHALYRRSDDAKKDKAPDYFPRLKLPGVTDDYVVGLAKTILAEDLGAIKKAESL
ncbi:MAG: hypothetical protein U1F52_05570 [Burkholderiales bacterium]